MTSYNRDYGIKQLHNGRMLNLHEQEDAKRREQEKKARKKVIAKAQALEREAYKRKMQRLCQLAGKYKDEPA